MQIIVENFEDAEELAEITAFRGRERGWRYVSVAEKKALADFIGEVGFRGDLYEFADNYLINGDFVENPTEEQKEEALFSWEAHDGITKACMRF